MIIESDQQVVAIVNTVGDGIYFASTTGFSAGSTSTNLPLLMKGNSGFDTWFNVQNCGTVSTNVTVTYSNATTETAAIAPGASKTFDQSTNAALLCPFCRVRYRSQRRTTHSGFGNAGRHRVYQVFAGL